MPHRSRRVAAWCAAFVAPLFAAAAGLPSEVDDALVRAAIPADALVAVVEEVGSTGSPRLALRADRPVNPASLMKLLTTHAGLELPGPAFRWTTPVWIDGPVDAGVLDGNLVIKGSGDPALVLERLWLLLRRVRQAGVREIRGDIVLDRSTFVLPPHDPAAFDGEPTRPSNVGPDALLLNYRSLVLGFAPDAAAGIARITVDVPLSGLVVDGSVALVAGPCGDWRGGLRADLADPDRIRFGGAYPAACGAQTWPVAYAAPAGYDERLLAGLWQEIGGTLAGRVRDGRAPAASPTFEAVSPPLADVVRDINKYSNNLMAEQLFLTLASAQGGVGTPEAARDVLSRWASERLGSAAVAGLVVDNGSGLSRDGRVSARLLARLLQRVAAGPLWSELEASLPLSGIDGTMRRSVALPGRAHLKTGSLRDVAGIAGFVLADSGRRYRVVAIVNHPNANRARPVFDTLVRWVADDSLRTGCCSPGSSRPRPDCSVRPSRDGCCRPRARWRPSPCR